jgi:CPA2 family monovalent cation:H+ antiporter-2
MGELHTLRDLVVLFAVAVAVLLHRLRLPAIAGFLVAGAVAGPAALGPIPGREDVDLLADIHVRRVCVETPPAPGQPRSA